MWAVAIRHLLAGCLQLLFTWYSILVVVSSIIAILEGSTACFVGADQRLRLACGD